MGKPSLTIPMEKTIIGRDHSMSKKQNYLTVRSFLDSRMVRDEFWKKAAEALEGLNAAEETRNTCWRCGKEHHPDAPCPVVKDAPRCPHCGVPLTGMNSNPDECLHKAEDKPRTLRELWSALKCLFGFHERYRVPATKENPALEMCHRCSFVKILDDENYQREQRHRCLESTSRTRYSRTD